MAAFSSLRDIINNVWDSVNSALRTESIGSAPGTSMNVQGVQATNTPITELPVLVAGQNSGNVKLFNLSAAGGVNQGDGNAGGAAAWTVEGALAVGSAVSGANPVVMAGANTSGNVAIPAVLGGLADANSNSVAGLFVNSYPECFNSATWDRFRNNTDVTLLASASRTTTQTSADITTFNLAGISVFLNMTVVGTGSVTVTINGKDPASGVYYNLLTGAAVITNSGNLYRIQPGIPAVANKDVNAYLPRVIQIVVTANNANAATYSVGYTLHNP